MIRLTLPALFLLTACVSNPAMTPAQELLLLRQDYLVVLDQAGDYRDQCRAKPVLLQTNCQRVVEELRAIHLEVMDLFDEAEAALRSGNDQRFSIASAAAARVKARLEQRLVDSIPRPQHKPMEPVS